MGLDTSTPPVNLASPGPIGGTTPAAITGTTITATTAFSGPGTVQLACVDTTEAINSMNSTTLVDSTALQLTLAVGTYWIETLELLGDSSTAAQNKSQLSFTGTATVGGSSVFSTSVNGTNGPLGTASYSITGISPGDGVPAVTGYDMDAVVPMSFSGGWTIRSGKLTVTVGGVLKIKSAQAVATVSNHWLFNGSYLKATRIA